MRKIMTPVFRTDPPLYHKCENIVFFGQEAYIRFVAQETRIIRKLFILNPKRSKSTIRKLYLYTN